MELGARQMTKLSPNIKLKSASLTCLQPCSAASLSRGRVITDERDWLSLSFFFNCLPHFNRNHLSLSAAKRQPVETLTPLRKRLFNTSHSTNIHCSNPPVNQPHTRPTRLLSHTLSIVSCISTVALQTWAKRDVKEKDRTLKSQHLHSFRGRWDSLLPIHHTLHPISL